MARLTKKDVQALKKQLGTVDIRLTGNKRINIEELCKLAIASIDKERPPARKVRFANAGEVTIWQKQCALESGIGVGESGGARLVWVPEADILDLGVEVKREKR